MDDVNIPNIGSGAEDARPLANFLKKDRPVIPAGIMNEMKIMIPAIWYWEDVVDGKSCLMTMAFKWKGRCYGQSFTMAEDITDNEIVNQRKILYAKVKESLDVLVHHGNTVLDSSGNIDPLKVSDQEAIRYKYDPYWGKKVAAFNKLVRVAPITRAKAIKLGLLDAPKVK